MIPPALRRLITPTHSVAHVSELSRDWLQSHGVRGIVCDLDNTLVVHNREHIAAEVADWLAMLRSVDIGVCLLSNTRRLWRLVQVGSAHGLLHVPQTAGKPGTAGLRHALHLLDVPPPRALMVGDQLFTDIVCGNRAGVPTVLVTPLSTTDFIGTQLISRPLERLLRITPRTE